MADKSGELVTIGVLARRAGLRPSTLRYYEQEGLLQPASRSQSGYRLYAPEAIDTLRFIQRAQRLGFSLSDIRLLLAGWQSGDLDDRSVLATAEARHLSLERQITEWQVQLHELQLFLQDLRQKATLSADSLFHQFVERVCIDPGARPPIESVLDWLMRYTGCVLTTDEGRSLLDPLRGQHVHVWQVDDAFHILVVSKEPQVGEALQQLAQYEEGCHAHPTPEVTMADEGFLFVAAGENAFIFARLFLALEQQSD